MVQVIIGNMRVCLSPHLPETGADLHLAGAGSTEWKALESKTYYRGCRVGINNVDAVCLERLIGSGYYRFEEDGRCWVGKDVGQFY